MRRVFVDGVMGAALLAGVLWAGAAAAADLPGPAGWASPARFGPPPQPGLLTSPFRGPYFIEPRRFDAYGDPVYGPVVVAAPNPLYTASGCPQDLRPVYDGLGNFAGYSPIQACR